MRIWQRGPNTPIAPHYVDQGVIVAVHFPVAVAVLLELVHVPLHRGRRAVRVQGAVLVRLGRLGVVVAERRLARVRPVAPGQPEGAAHVARAAGGHVAARYGLADAGKALLAHLDVVRRPSMHQEREQKHCGDTRVLDHCRGGRRRFVTDKEVLRVVLIYS